MTRASLQKYRLVVPGMLAVLLAMSLTNPGLEFVGDIKQVVLKNYTIPGFFGFLIGALYHIFDVRTWLSGFLWTEVNQNLKFRLMGVIRRNRILTVQEREFLYAKQHLLDIFYKIIDSDETLKSKMQGVYFNGLLVTSTVDVCVISLTGSLLHFLAGFILGDYSYLWWGGSLFVVFILFRTFVVPKTKETHEELSNEQLNVIESHHTQELSELTAAVLQGMPETAES